MPQETVKYIKEITKDNAMPKIGHDYDSLWIELKKRPNTFVHDNWLIETEFEWNGKVYGWFHRCKCGMIVPHDDDKEVIGIYDTQYWNGIHCPKCKEFLPLYYEEPDLCIEDKRCETYQ